MRQALASPDRTLVIYMGLSRAGAIAGRLMAAGLVASTPVAIIQNGTREDQSVSVGRLAELGVLADAHADAGPALLVIGGVVTRRHRRGRQRRKLGRKSPHGESSQNA